MRRVGAVHIYVASTCGTRGRKELILLAAASYRQFCLAGYFLLCADGWHAVRGRCQVGRVQIRRALHVCYTISAACDVWGNCVIGPRCYQLMLLRCCIHP
jgi:hypothetical protein